jgi:hypothetical protein
MFGILYISVGMMGFIPAMTTPAGDDSDDGLLMGIFGVNTMHNVAHLLP